MKWLQIAKMILDLILSLPLEAPEQEPTQEAVEARVRETLTNQQNRRALTDEARAMGYEVAESEWEELIPHIAAIITFLLRKFSSR